MSEENLDSLLDLVLDDLEDLPSFEPFAPGLHQVTATFSVEEINKKTAVKLDFKYVELVELADDNATPPRAGDECGTVFFLDNEFGLGNLKKWGKVFSQAMDLDGRVSSLVENVKDVECVLCSSVRKDKNDPDRFYLNIKDIQVV